MTVVAPYRPSARACLLVLALSLAMLAVFAGPAAAAASPAPLWRLDFESGNFGQWDQLNGNLAQRARYFGIVAKPSPVGQGRYAFRSTVDAGAVEAGQAGQRSMALVFPDNVASKNKTGAYEGGERWYRTQLYFPADFHPSPNSAWNWLVQWHNWPDGPCCSNLALAVDARHGRESLSLRVMGGGDREHPVENNDIITEKNPAGQLEWFVGDATLRREHWYESVMHVKWSASPSKGLVEWWLDGRLITARKMSTLYWYADNNRNYAGATPGPGQAYYMEGYYRPATLPDGKPGGPVDTSSATVYFDGAAAGTTLESVAPCGPGSPLSPASTGRRPRRVCVSAALRSRVRGRRGSSTRRSGRG